MKDEATPEMIAMARQIAGGVWERRAMTWREREGLPDNPAWRAHTRNAWERGDYDAEDAVQAALAAIIETTEKAAKLAADTIDEARLGEIDNDLRCIKHVMVSRLANSAHLKEQSNA